MKKLGIISLTVLIYGCGGGNGSQPMLQPDLQTQGQLTINANGLPQGQAAKLTLSSASMAATTVIDGSQSLPAGTYQLNADNVTVANRVYVPTQRLHQVVIEAGNSFDYPIQYQQQLQSSYGMITRFGNMSVNGQPVDLANAPLHTPYSPQMTIDHLQAGMNLFTMGPTDLSSTALQAEQLIYLPAIRGPIARVNLASGHFNIGEQQVNFNENTIWLDSHPALLAGAQWLEVNGHYDQAGQLMASHIAAITASSAWLVGPVAQAGDNENEITIGNYTIDGAQISHLGAFGHGQWMAIELASATGLPQWPSAQLISEIAPQANHLVRHQGMVTALGDDHFWLESVRVSLDNDTRWANGALQSLALDQMICVMGQWTDQGLLHAEQIQVTPASTLWMTGVPSAVGESQDWLEMFGQRFYFDQLTVFPATQQAAQYGPGQLWGPDSLLTVEAISHPEIADAWLALRVLPSTGSSLIMPPLMLQGVIDGSDPLGLNGLLLQMHQSSLKIFDHDDIATWDSMFMNFDQEMYSFATAMMDPGGNWQVQSLWADSYSSTSSDWANTGWANMGSGMMSGMMGMGSYYDYYDYYGADPENEAPREQISGWLASTEGQWMLGGYPLITDVNTQYIDWNLSDMMDGVPVQAIGHWNNAGEFVVEALSHLVDTGIGIQGQVELVDPADQTITLMGQPIAVEQELMTTLEAGQWIFARISTSWDNQQRQLLSFTPASSQVTLLQGAVTQQSDSQWRIAGIDIALSGGELYVDHLGNSLAKSDLLLLLDKWPRAQIAGQWQDGVFEAQTITLLWY